MGQFCWPVHPFFGGGGGNDLSCSCRYCCPAYQVHLLCCLDIEMMKKNGYCIVCTYASGTCKVPIRWGRSGTDAVRVSFPGKCSNCTFRVNRSNYTLNLGNAPEGVIHFSKPVRLHVGADASTHPVFPRLLMQVRFSW
ncbi:hypothetical protein B0O99DRAFT_138545 [Bisporella sp. PMI_857]|nr:hypothetical protein B0O99DRAFT_138545 [Bisporella sp. PMI_857]